MLLPRSGVGGGLSSGPELGGTVPSVVVVDVVVVDEVVVDEVVVDVLAAPRCDGLDLMSIRDADPWPLPLHPAASSESAGTNPRNLAILRDRIRRTIRRTGACAR